jgi:hypothetical protein
MDSILVQYRKIAKRAGRPVVLVSHRHSNSPLSMAGGVLPVDFEAARAKAAELIASGHFSRATIIKPDGTIWVRIPGLKDVWVEDKPRG